MKYQNFDSFFVQAGINCTEQIGIEHYFYQYSYVSSSQKSDSVENRNKLVMYVICEAIVVKHKRKMPWNRVK